MNEMLDFLKAVSSADRLRIIGLLAQKRATRAEISAQLTLPAREVFDHLEFLEQVGVVSQKDDLFELNPDKLTAFARERLAQERQAYIPAPGLDDKSRRVLRACLNPDGSVKQVPGQLAKLQVILHYLVQAFAPQTDYTEKEVNDILRRFNEDTAGLRRDLVDAGLLARESDGSRYWRVESGVP
jgi:hypothetical protein